MEDQSVKKDSDIPVEDISSIPENICNKNQISQIYNTEEHAWVLFFSFSSWLAITIVFLTGIYKNILISADRKYPVTANDGMIHTVIVDQKSINQQIEPDKEYFLSDKNNMGSGNITEKKGFEALSRSRELRIGKDGETDQESEEAPEKTSTENILSNHFTSKILDNKFIKESDHKKYVKKFSRSSIPDNFNFNKEFAFSWDRNGQPVIPTMYYKHFKYFKSMLDKIQSNWAPPGGSPYPIYDNSFNTSGYVPGRTTYKTFPDQEILIVFTLDEAGNINEIRLIKSLGFESLDRSCKDAIERSINFGPPPEELSKNGVFVMPLTFRIMSRMEE
ncbi:MAG: TonB C-terminal domain-containing protein [Spirochaetia bacterium]|nr:TonB C-terminal domain-containing protein [Spirochaetia bacterium]